MYRKTLGLFYLLTVILTILFALSSCGFFFGNTPNNGDDDGDVVTKPVDTALYLPITSGGEGMITVVSAYTKEPGYAEAYKELMDNFTSVGIKLDVAYQVSSDPDKPEIIIGDKIGATGDYYIVPYTLGDEGYAIRVIGNKIVIAGGSVDSLATAIRLFSSSVLKLGDPQTDINNLALARSTDIYVRQSYPITSITVGGRDIQSYSIVCNTSDTEESAAADKLHGVLYNRAGYWLDVRSSSNNPAIRIRTTDYAGEDGFRVYVDGYDLIIECAYKTMFTYAIDTFIDDFFGTGAEQEISFGNGVYTVKVSEISYADYGAVGDGVTDDFEAIKAAHEAANRTGQTVIAESGKTYYLGQHAESIIIKTNTVWKAASFIIDDSSILPNDAASRHNVFSVDPDSYSTSVMGISSLRAGQTNVGVTFDGPTLLYLVYSDNKQYIRYGANADSGADQQEIILVDKDGNVDTSTPILWDYPALTSVTAYSASDKPITIEGGSFLTIANAAPREYTYYTRGIRIRRSNVTVDGLVHTITGEGDTGAPYNGFISVSYCNNILVKNTVLTGHKVYKLSSDVNNSMGTYDISVNSANNVTFLNCSQTNSITDTAYWGIMGSNYCKNLTYDGCVFSRFDAHKGTHNATIRNSEIGHQRLNIIGSGTLIVENTTVHSNNIINLRNDYGSTWQGDIILRNITLMNTSSTPTLINANWYNHDFGYTCYLPENITIDGITLAKGNKFYVLPGLSVGIDKDTVLGVENKNPVVLTKKIVIASNPNNYTYYVSTNGTLFGEVELIEEE